MNWLKRLFKKKDEPKPLKVFDNLGREEKTIVCMVCGSSNKQLYKSFKDKYICKDCRGV